MFAWRATQFEASCGHVGKLEYKFMGLWRVTESLHGGSYSIEHCLKPNCTEKMHVSNLMPYPVELIPFELIDGPDTQYG
jgi:hypothetical protein